jgi:hypothetical protein
MPGLPLPAWARPTRPLRPPALPLALWRAVRIRRELRTYRGQLGLGGDQLQRLAQLRLWHQYRDAAAVIARLPGLDRFLRGRGLI